MHCSLIFFQSIVIVIDYSELAGLSDKIIVIYLLSITSIILILLLCLVSFQLFYITHNITTSESLRKKYSGDFPFDKGNCENLKQFFCNISDYRKNIEYNDMAKNYLDENILVDGFNSSNLIVSGQNKI